MRSDQSEIERSLPRRNVGAPRCPSPFCENETRVPGELCKSCRDQVERHREAMRAFNSQRTA